MLLGSSFRLEIVLRPDRSEDDAVEPWENDEKLIWRIFTKIRLRDQGPNAKNLVVIRARTEATITAPGPFPFLP